MRRAGNWLLDSGIQEESGGVARYYRIDLGQNKRVSSEITGYAVSAYCYLYGRTSDPRFLDAARLSARFLIDNVWDPRAQVFPFEWPPTAIQPENRVYFFDSGIIVRSLLALWRITRDTALLDTAAAAGCAMARVFIRGGNYDPILDHPSLQPIPYGGSWSNNPGCYQLKSALAWYELFHATGEKEFEQAWEHALGLALSNGPSFLPGTDDTPKVMDRLHAFSYYLEALIPIAGRSEAREELRAGIERAAGYLRRIAPLFDRSDVYAQILRVRLLADAAGAVPLDWNAAAEEAAAIPHFQFASPDPRIDGGFCFGRRKNGPVPHANPVSTAFCLQAISMWEQRQHGKLQDTWQVLI